jgi:hypothetical protein
VTLALDAALVLFVVARAQSISPRGRIQEREQALLADSDRRHADAAAVEASSPVVPLTPTSAGDAHQPRSDAELRALDEAIATARVELSGLKAASGVVAGGSGAMPVLTGESALSMLLGGTPQPLRGVHGDAAEPHTTEKEGDTPGRVSEAWAALAAANEELAYVACLASGGAR